MTVIQVPSVLPLCQARSNRLVDIRCNHSDLIANMEYIYQLSALYDDDNRVYGSSSILIPTTSLSLRESGANPVLGPLSTHYSSTYLYSSSTCLPTYTV